MRSTKVVSLALVAMGILCGPVQGFCHINIFFREADEGYIADIPDLSHCAAFGETPDQALWEC